MLIAAFALIGLVVGALVFRDANRLAQHVKVAEVLMAAGLSEDEAMERSGCNFWDQAWHRRMTKRYPTLTPSS